ncbi:MAG: hypothetical protein HRT72_08085 [Flavobacteriales bacterium]|nr:hypothetical protein [Flavobacteriales bacterium]
MRAYFLVFALLMLSINTFSQSDIIHIPTDSTDYFVVKNITFEGNKVTKERIILRELNFHIGDTIKRIEIEERFKSSANNVTNTSLFNFVTITKKSISFIEIEVNIKVQERWYFWGSPIFELADDILLSKWWEDKRIDRTNYGLYFVKKNFRGRKESLKLKIQLGFEESINLNYNVPYIDRKQKSGLSFGASYRQYHDFNILTRNDKRIFHEDTLNFSRVRRTAYSNYTYRPDIYNRHILGLGYDRVQIADTAAVKNPNYLGRGKNSLEFFKLNYVLKQDHRNNKAYPLKGYYFEIEGIQHGINIFKNDLNVLNIKAQYRRYTQLSDRWYSAASMRIKLSNNSNQPYYLNNGLGYSSWFVRGYEKSYIDGQNVGLLKGNLKYNLIKQTTVDVGWPKKFKKFTKIHYAIYLNAFIDAGYTSNRYKYFSNKLDNSLLLGYGLGLDYVTYYDKVGRIEFSIDKSGKSGVYFHFIAPI